MTSRVRQTIETSHWTSHSSSNTESLVAGRRIGGTTYLTANLLRVMSRSRADTDLDSSRDHQESPSDRSNSANPVNQNDRRTFYRDEAALLWHVFKMKPIPEVSHFARDDHGTLCSCDRPNSLFFRFFFPR